MISCISAVMNRERPLEQMLPTWTSVDKIKEFVIVDWSSHKPIIENDILQQEMLKYKNIKVVRVENQKYFYRCLAWNLANQYTNPTYKILLKLDIDYMNLNHDWIDCLHLRQDLSLDNYFITGAFKFYENSLGFLLVNKKDFGKGYNENLLPIWGYEDQDLIKRLSKQTGDYSLQGSNEWQGLKHIIFFNIKNHIYHIPHDNIQRIINEENYDILGNDVNRDPRKMYAQSRRNAKVMIEKPHWEPKEFEILENQNNYIRVKLIE